MMIPCEHGHICPWGGENLAACTRTAGPVAMRLRSLPFVEVVQDGADGVNAVFPADRFDEVAAVIKPKRRRVLSPEARQAAAERLVPYRFSPAVRSPHTGLGSVPARSVDG